MPFVVTIIVTFVSFNNFYFSMCPFRVEKWESWSTRKLFFLCFKLDHRLPCFVSRSDKTDRKGMASSTEDYGSELQELQWGGGSGSHFLRSGTHFLRSGTGGCYEAEDLESTSRHHGGQHRGYYSPPGTSYTIVERPPSAPHHHSSHTTPYRHRGHATGGSGAISPEQVLR